LVFSKSGLAAVDKTRFTEGKLMFLLHPPVRLGIWDPSRQVGAGSTLLGLGSRRLQNC